MSEKYTQKWCLISLLEKCEEGYEFHRGEWPIHVTLIGAFDVAWNGGLHQKLETAISEQKTIKIWATKESLWGPKGSIKVSEIELTADLKELHLKLHGLLSSNGAVFNDPQYMGENYTPHNTVQKSGRVEVGEKIELTSLTLVDMFPKQNGHMRKIMKTTQFRGET